MLKTGISGKFHDVNRFTLDENRLHAFIFEIFSYDNRLTLDAINYNYVFLEKSDN